MQDAVIVQDSDRTRDEACCYGLRKHHLGAAHNKIATIKGCTSRDGGAEPACWDCKAAGYYDRLRTAESGPLTQAVDHATYCSGFLGCCDAV